LFSQAIGELDGGGGFAGRTGTADPHHADVIALIEAVHDFGGGGIEGLFVEGEGIVDERFKFAGADDFVEALDGMTTTLLIPGEDLLHAIDGKTVAHKSIGRDRALAKPMTSPAVTGVGVGGILKAITAQRMEDLVLDNFDGRREVGDEVMRIGIETNDDGFGKETGDSIVGGKSLKDGAVNVGE